MSESGRRFIFAGHAIGAAAQFHRLDDVHDLNHVVPVLGGSVLAGTGGLARSHVPGYCLEVDQPRKRKLLQVGRIETSATGKDFGDSYETEVEGEVHALEVVEKLRIEFVRVHLLSLRDADKEHASIRSKGNRIEGVYLGAVQAKIVLDEDLLAHCATHDQLADFYRNQSSEYRRKNSWRFNTGADATEIAAHHGHCKCSIVREIKLIGPEDERSRISVDGYTITWRGFGRIIVGEVIVKHDDRRLTMVRLAMGSDAGGSGSVGCARSNGQIGTS